MLLFLAEDNEDNYLVVKSNLRKLAEPAELVWARDGAEAMEMLESMEHVDLFLVDIAMPRVDGLELTRWIKTQERFAKTPVVAITASVFAEMKKRYLDEGMDRILEKPFSRQEFLQVLKETGGFE